MLAKERLAYIVNRLQVRPSISIQNLSKEMNVSLSTVQRDLRKLEQDGRIERSFGGAISNQVSKVLSERNEIAVSEKIHIHKAEKEIIAKVAVQQIQEGECIFLDSGTTIAHMVPYLMSKHITIVTNSLYLQRNLVGCLGQVFLLGGVYNTKFDMTLGSATNMALEELHFDRAFMSASGIDLKCKELYSVESDIASIKKIVLKRAEHKYVLVDHSKFMITAIHTFAKVNDFDYIFTDKEIKSERIIKNLYYCK
ncbi:MAG: DeoR/GlpR family DNA-binding transcription regulator [Longicatena sp.]